MVNIPNLVLNDGVLWSLVLTLGVLTLCWWIGSLLSNRSPDLRKQWILFVGEWRVTIYIVTILVFLGIALFIGYKNPPDTRTIPGSLETKSDKTVETATDEDQHKKILKEGDRLQKSGQDSLDDFRKRLLNKGE